MATALDYPHIEKPAGEPARLQRLPRVRVAQIAMDYLAHGWSADELCRQHPDLKPAEVHAALAYYFDHSDEVDREIQTEVDLVERAAVSAPVPSFVRRLKAKAAR